QCLGGVPVMNPDGTNQPTTAAATPTTKHPAGADRAAANRGTSDPTITSSEATTLERLTKQFVDRYREILEGMPEGEPTWVTSGGREGGLYGTIADIDAAQASRDIASSSIAAH